MPRAAAHARGHFEFRRVCGNALPEFASPPKIYNLWLEKLRVVYMGMSIDRRIDIDLHDEERSL